MPRPIPESTTLGKLRKTLQLSAASIASATGVAKGTIHAIEGGHRKMTDAIARRIGGVYMVDPTWLTDNLPVRPIRDIDGIPWRADTPGWRKNDFGSEVEKACTRLIKRSRRDARGGMIPIALYEALEKIVMEFYPDEKPDLLPSSMRTPP